jgi:hypothetical protein
MRPKLNVANISCGIVLTDPDVSDNREVRRAVVVVYERKQRRGVANGGAIEDEVAAPPHGITQSQQAPDQHTT